MYTNKNKHRSAILRNDACSYCFSDIESIQPLHCSIHDLTSISNNLIDHLLQCSQIGCIRMLRRLIKIFQ